MKIAILICGHLRTWKHTRKSFEEVFCADIKPDIYVHTYSFNQSSDANNCPPQEELNYTSEEIIELFKGLNVKEMKIDPNQIEADRYIDHLRVIQSCYDMSSVEAYDIVIKTRADIVYSKPNWEVVYKMILQNKIAISDKGTWGFPNDQIGAGSQLAMSRYCNRYNNYLDKKILSPCIHKGLAENLQYYNISLGEVFVDNYMIRSKNLFFYPPEDTNKDTSCLSSLGVIF